MKASLRVLIVNERFLPRFGVDRILALLAAHLVREGFETGFACLRCDRPALEKISSEIMEIAPPPGLDMAGTEGFVSDHLVETWRTGERPDVIVVGGWPFFTLGARAGAMGIQSIFIDAGAVPHDGFPDEALPIQLELRRLRRLTLPYMGKILPISDFIRASQTEPEHGGASNVATVHLGADHIGDASGEGAGPTGEEARLLERLFPPSSRDEPLVLSLGRFEPLGYKNSPRIFEIFRGIRARVKDARLVLLGGGDTIDPPRDLRDHVTTLPAISDEALSVVMRRSAVGLSVSLWEGFNLPIAEMQWLNRPALAFNIGAHPEIISDPWLLCESSAEMTRKAIEILTRGGDIETWLARGNERFRERFTWARTLARWTEEISGSGKTAVASLEHRQSRLVFIDVSNSCRDPGNSGVIRVTRRLASGISSRSGFEVVFVVWDEQRKCYSLPTHGNPDYLESNGGPSDWLGKTASGCDPDAAGKILRSIYIEPDRAPVLLLPEVILDGTAEDRVAWARQKGCKVAFILYDMLPIYSREMVAGSVSAAFPAYIRAVASGDAIWSISGFSKTEFERYLGENSLQAPERREVVWLPGQFGAYPRRIPRVQTSKEINILFVSTLEPRKNHMVLLEGFDLARRRRPDLPLFLHIVGNSYTERSEILEAVKQAAEDDDHIKFHGLVSDAMVATLYEKAAFTVYPSLVEGFGLPILESLWMGCPCICGETGVMAELAEDGGCVMVDVRDPYEISAAIERVADDNELYRALQTQINDRKINQWSNYAGEIVSRIGEL